MVKKRITGIRLNKILFLTIIRAAKKGYPLDSLSLICYIKQIIVKIEIKKAEVFIGKPYQK